MHDCTVTPSPGVPPRGNRGCLLAHGLHFGGTQGPWRPYACGSATSHGTRNPHNRWRMRGGVGLASLSIGGTGESGFGFVTGLGYDVRIARNTSITPVANYNWGAPESGLKQHVFQIALGITFH